MQELLRTAREALEFDEECVLCTVVRLVGSGYGRPGARLLLTQSGERVGYISGGCLEKDLCRQAWSLTERGPRLIAYDTRSGTIHPSRFNTGCEGIVSILCQRIRSLVDPAIRIPALLDHHDTPVKLATIYRSSSPYFQAGDTIAVLPDSDIITDLSSVHSPVFQQVLIERILEAGQTHSVELQDQEGNAIEVFIELLTPPPHLVICGAGDDVIPVVEFARRLDWKVTVLGHRPELTTPARFERAHVRCGQIAEMLEEMTLGPRCYPLLMTHDFACDVQLLPTLLESAAPSIGILGPKRRLARLVQELADSGRTVSPEEADRIRAPLGLDLGAITPAEIACSIVAEIIALERGRSGRPLHDSRHPIHDAAPHQSETQPPSRSMRTASVCALTGIDS
ncbi:XdhC family protein [Rubinisphaera margarita]|uniref:XdhC family protein n=1 Tax=Rubinisphaera margarita TaxID=2909586 RepID=UPI001EE784B2|nr:XdhC/CoxI family protein [Rubinisphaera margarita]MCG6156487.1 XdhC family protein [Rubinisphaera margarita]